METKIFTSRNGEFQILIPLHWEYKNPEIYPNGESLYAFSGQQHEKGAFQLSCRNVNQHILEIISNNQLKIHEAGKYNLDFLEISHVKPDSSPFYTWMCAVSDHFVFATYNFSRKDYSAKTIRNEIKTVKNVLSSFRFIETQYRDKVLKQDRFGKFMVSLAASIDLTNRAIESASFIEMVILVASRIDGLLRLAVLLNDQLTQNSNEIDTSLIFQDGNDKIVMERQVYQIALERSIISESLFIKLNDLYKERNKVVHRYIITDIRTIDLMRIASSYFQIHEEVSEITNAFEAKQFELNIGVNAGETAPGDRFKEKEWANLRSRIRDKHGKINWEKIRESNSGNNQV